MPQFQTCFPVFFQYGEIEQSIRIHVHGNHKYTNALNRDLVIRCWSIRLKVMMYEYSVGLDTLMMTI